MEAFIQGDRQAAGPFEAFDQYFDIAVGQLETLNDVDDRADLENLIRSGVVDRGIVLRRQENLLVGLQSVFQGPDARFPTHHERGHHVREDHNIPDRHHREPLGQGLFLR